MSAGDPGLTVRVRFQVADESAARALAARLIDRAHELANLPECECDLDVDVEWNAPPRPADGTSSDRAPERPTAPAPVLRSDR